MTAAELQAFMEFAERKLDHPAVITLEDCLRQWREVQQLQEAIQEIEAMHEAAAGCGYSRDEIAAQYRDRLEKLR